MNEKKEAEKVEKHLDGIIPETKTLKEKFIDKWSNWWIINKYPEGELTEAFRAELNHLVKIQIAKAFDYGYCRGCGHSALDKDILDYINKTSFI